MRALSKLKRGFTLVELMIVVAIIGVLAAMAVYGIGRYMANTKAAEARNALGGIGKAAVRVWKGESDTTSVSTILATGTSAVFSGGNTICGGSKIVPAAAPKSAKYQSSPADWKGAGNPFECLKFSIGEPQRYAYSYNGTATDFAAAAVGDLDGDGATSVFVYGGAIVGNTTTGQDLTLLPAIVDPVDITE